MKSQIWALLVHDKDHPVGKLQPVLSDLSVRTLRVRSCEAAAWLVLPNSEPPHLVFTDITLPDGNWQKVLDLTTRAEIAVNLIVVAPRGDSRLEVEVIVRGAFDLIWPPFSTPAFGRLVRHAVDNAFSRRRDQRPHLLQEPRPPARSDVRKSAARSWSGKQEAK